MLLTFSSYFNQDWMFSGLVFCGSPNLLQPSPNPPPLSLSSPSPLHPPSNPPISPHDSLPPPPLFVFTFLSSSTCSSSSPLPPISNFSTFFFLIPLLLLSFHLIL